MAEPLLYIYDATVGDGDLGDYTDDGTIVRVAATRDQDLYKGLDDVLASGQTFTRVLWATHGESGQLRFGGDQRWNDTTWSNFYWTKKGYSRLFPRFTSMWFSGCNIGEDDAGLRFLAAAGKALLRAGGIVKAWDSYGIRGFDGTIRHWWGDQRFVQLAPGGVVTIQGTVEATPVPFQHDCVGNRC